MRIPLLGLLLLSISSIQAQQWNWAVDAGGGGNTDQCYGIATDSEGNVYWAGSVSGTVVFDCGTVTAPSSIAGFISKYDPAGNCLWVQGINVGFNDAYAYDIAIDAEDRIYITGSYNGNATFNNGVTLASLGSDDIFVARYNTEGECQWARRAGSSGSSDEARGIAVSSDGALFIAGISGGTTIRFDDILIPNPGNYRQIVVARYDSTGTVQWAKTSSGTGQDKSARGISVANDRLFITGQFSFATGTFDGYPLVPVNVGGTAYILSCDLDGNVQWGHSYGSGDHEGMGITADTLGNVFMVGRLRGSMYLPDDTLVWVSNDDDFVILKFDADGSYQWGKSTGSTERDLSWGADVDGQGNVYVAVQFHNTVDFFGTPLTGSGGEDIAILKMDGDGDVVWANKAGAGNRDVPLCIHRQAAAPNKLYFGGYYWGPVTYGSTTIDDMGNGDAMMVSAVDTTFDVSLYTAEICPGSCIAEAIAFANGVGPFTYAWSIGATTQIIDELCPGFYIVEVTDANGQVRVDTVYVEEVTDPGYTVQVQGDSLWTTGGTSWQWFFNDEMIAGADSASYVAAQTGNYHAQLTDPNGCMWSTDTVLVVLNTGLVPMASSAVRIVPNPAIDVVHVRTDRRVVSIVAWDVSGRITTVPMIGPQTFSVADLASGIWLLELRTDDGDTTMTRLVKQ
jgi:hypothetical protein